MTKTLFRMLLAVVALIAVVVLFFALNVYAGMHAHARYTGTISGLPLRAPVAILRDDRGVPHIIASNDHDLFFAEGYAEGSDRLFQMDLLRRFVLGDLSEVFGKSALSSDEGERAIPVRQIVQEQWRQLDLPTRKTLGAFSDGVNAAMEREPLPVEFRILAYRPAPWTPEDSLAVGMATVLDLIDDWNAVASRNAAYRAGGAALLGARFPLTDPCYDAPVLQGLAGMASGPACRGHVASLLRELRDPRPPIGSNEWAVGANHVHDGHALLANDPHLGLQIPGPWYLVDLHAPDLHAAGATFAGNPGVVLGHNERVAWGATDGTVTSISVFMPPEHLDPHFWQTERFAVRFGGTATKQYYRTPRLFALTTRHGDFVLVRWSAYDEPIAPAPTFLYLDRASSIDQALAILRRYPGPTMNFTLADASGRAAYLLAGEIPNDPVRARWFHPSSDLAAGYPMFPASRLPYVAPSRNAVLWTANNKVYGNTYPLALSPQFAPPYRAYRIAQLLRARHTYDVAYFTQMQMDVLSLSERELARDLAAPMRAIDPGLANALGSWDGEMDGDSSTATVVEGLRAQLTRNHTARVPTLLETIKHTDAVLHGISVPSPAPWSIAGAVPVAHPLSNLGISLLDGTTFPGYGDALTVHVQYSGYSQSFRAVWEVSNWDAGGITLPQGESGQPGSGHYIDQAGAWTAGRLWPLPFSDAAVQSTALQRETLLP